MTGAGGIASQPLGRRAWAALLVVLVAAVCGIRASASRKVGGDFLRYHRAGRMVATGLADRLYDPDYLLGQHVYAAERAALAARDGAQADPLQEHEFKYAPALAVLVAPLGTLPPRAAWIVWGAWNGAMAALTFLAAWSFAARGASWRWMLVPAVLLARAAGDNANLGQLNPSAIAPATLALWALDRGRDRTAGALAALGTVVKFIPAGLAIWFAWKRRWAALLQWIGVTAVVGVGLPAIFLGGVRSVRLHEAWLDARAHVYAGAAADDLPGHSVKSFVYRVFGGVHYRTGAGAHRIDWDVSVMQAGHATLQVVVLAVCALLLAAVLWRTRGPLRTGGDPRGPPEAGLLVGWLLLASPEARSPHFLYLALPLAALTYGLVRAFREGRPLRHAALVLAIGGALLVNTDSESIHGREIANRLEAFCALGWATLAVMGALGLLLASRTDDGAPAEANPPAA